MTISEDCTDTTMPRAPSFSEYPHRPRIETHHHLAAQSMTGITRPVRLIEGQLGAPCAHPVADEFAQELAFDHLTVVPQQILSITSPRVIGFEDLQAVRA